MKHRKLHDLTPVELLQTHGAVIDELMRRNIVRTRNNPIGDYTEWLVCHRLDLEMLANSKASIDAVDPAGIQYQIKGRQSEDKRVQFSAIRNLDEQTFDFVIAVVFHRDYSIRFAVRMTHAAVLSNSVYRQHVNAHILILSDDVIALHGVEDIAGDLIGRS